MAGRVIAVMQSESNPAKSYEIRLSKDGSHSYCTCPSWKFQSLPPKQRTCKHLRALKAAMQKVA